jgi:hypothetical protein
LTEVSSRDEVLRSLATETTKALKSDVAFDWPDVPQQRSDDPPSPVVTAVEPVKEPAPIPEAQVDTSTNSGIAYSAVAPEARETLEPDVSKTAAIEDVPEHRSDDPPSRVVTAVEPVKVSPPIPEAQVDPGTDSGIAYSAVAPEARETLEPGVSKTAAIEIDSEIADPTPPQPVTPDAAQQKKPMPNVRPKPPQKVAVVVPEPAEPAVKKRVAIVKPKGSALTGRRREDAGWQNYVAHVVSSENRSEVRATLKRIRATRGGLVRGLTTRIVKSNVDGSMVYTAGFGPLPTHQAAVDLCRRLLAAGESDCVVWPPWSQAN